MQRESLKSRLGFILLSAGCAIGIGNVWRFPYITGKNGGGVFVLIYLFFLIAVGVPIMTMEFSIGRASRKSAICAYQELAPKGSKWHIHGKFALLGNYILMMFYTSVTGWMMQFCFQYCTGEMSAMGVDGVDAAFGAMLSRPVTLTFWMIVVVLLGFGICALGLQNGVERITKGMMFCLLGLILMLAVHSLTLDGAMEGVRFYLYPDLDRMAEVGILRVIVDAMNQSFFTLSLGIGSMLIFGSYMGRDRSLLGESVTIGVLDTFVALVAGLIIFPACFSFGVSPDSGPSLIFITLPKIFNSMAGGRLWGSLFFLFMTFASMSTIVAVFENILASCMDWLGWDRKKAACINIVLVAVGSIPCVLGFNVWSAFQPLGAGSCVLDLEDFIVSNLLLPIGSLVYLLFCVSRVGWGFDNYLKECNAGQGVKMPRAIRFYVTYILPVLVFVLIAQGLWSVFAKLFLA